jgi:hypothetical protein
MTPDQIKKRAVDFCKWFMELKTEDLIYYIVEEGTDLPIAQYYSRSEMYDKYIQLI